MLKNIVISILTVAALLLLCFFLYGIWAQRQIAAGLQDLQSNQHEIYMNGHNRLLALGDLALPRLLELTVAVQPVAEGHDIAGDQIFWRCVALLGEIGNPAAIPLLRACLQDDQLASFGDCCHALTEIALNNPGHPESDQVFDAMADAFDSSQNTDNQAAALAILKDHGNAQHAAIIVQKLLRDGGNVEDMLLAVENIARRGHHFAVNGLQDTRHWMLRVFCGRILCWMGDERGIDFLAATLRHRSEITDDRVLYFAANGFDIFTGRNLNFIRAMRAEKKEESYIKYLKWYDECRSEGEPLLLEK